MPFLICTVPVCPIRSEPFHRSEQISQLLFGEVCEVLDTAPDFSRVRCLYDDYEGWCQTSQLLSINENSIKEKSILTTGWITEITFNSRPMRVPLGSSIGVPGIDQSPLSESTWKEGEQPPNDELVKRFALLYLNTPYLWGGRSVFGVDCSGFCQTVFKFFGIKLQRDAYQQATQGEAIGFVQEARCGDLAFFDNAEGRITHVGIMLDQQTIIHSSGKVRIDKIDHTGITNVDTGTNTHQLRIIKRYF